MANRRVTLTISAADSFSTTIDQYKRKLGEADTTTDNFNRKAGSTKTQFEKIGDAISTMFAGYITGRGLDILGDLNQIGIEARNVQSLYDTITQEGADPLLDDLRERTRGMVTDTSLMAGAAQFLRLGIAGTNEEAAQLVEIALGLKKPSEDAASAINNFSLMLANNSTLRLDSFGLSASAVKERMQELMDSGEALNTSDAFRMATIEAGTRQLAEFESYLDSTSTAAGRLGIAMQNLRDDLALGVAQGVESGAQLIEMFGLLAQYGKEDFNLLTQGINPDQRDALANRIFNQGSVRGLEFDNQAYFNAALMMMQGDQNMMSALSLPPDLLRQTAGERGLPADLIQNFEDLFGVTTGVGGPSGQALNDYLDLLDIMREIQAIDERAAQQQRAEFANTLGGQIAAGFNLAIESGNALLTRVGDVAREMGSAQIRMFGEQDAFGRAFGEFQSLDTNFMSRSGMEIMNPADFEAIDDAVADVEQRYQNIQQLASETPGLVSETQLEQMGQMVEQAQSFRDRAAEASAAFSNMSLAQLFGQTDGGQVQEFFDLVLARAGARDMGSDFIDPLSAAFGLNSGSETAASQFAAGEGSDIVLGIAQAYGTDAAAEAGRRFVETYRSAIAEGFSDQEALNAGQGALGFDLGEDGQLIELPDTDPMVEAFEDVQAAVAETDMDPMVTGTEELVTNAETFQGIINEVDGSVLTIGLEFVLAGMSGLDIANIPSMRDAVTRIIGGGQTAPVTAPASSGAMGSGSVIPGRGR